MRVSIVRAAAGACLIAQLALPRLGSMPAADAQAHATVMQQTALRQAGAPALTDTWTPTAISTDTPTVTATDATTNTVALSATGAISGTAPLASPTSPTMATETATATNAAGGASQQRGVVRPDVNYVVSPVRVSALRAVTTAATLNKVDVFFIFDMTGSMASVINANKANATAIMRDIQSKSADSAFGAAYFDDYFYGNYAQPAAFPSYTAENANAGSSWSGGYSNNPSDTPFAVANDISTNIYGVQSAINAIPSGAGGDTPEAQVRALWEAAQPDTIHWRAGAKRIVVLLTDSPVHDPNFAPPGTDPATGAPFTSRDTGWDPGRDGVIGTADDLRFSDPKHPTYAAVQADQRAGITILPIIMNYADAFTVAEYGYAAQQTGGTEVVADPTSTEGAASIQSAIEAAVGASTVKPPTTAGGCPLDAAQSGSGVTRDDEFCSSAPSDLSTAPQVSVSITRFYGSVCENASGPYDIDPGDLSCKSVNMKLGSPYTPTHYGALQRNVIGTGVANYADISVNVSGSIIPETTIVKVNGVTASPIDPNMGGWKPIAAGFQFNGTISSKYLAFPNLNLWSTTIKAPFSAPNTISLDNLLGNQASIYWARLHIDGTRPVVLAHGIIPPDLFTIAAHPGSYQAAFNPDDLNGWKAWDNWVGSATIPLPNDIEAAGQGFLRRIGVPNIRPAEESYSNAAPDEATPCGSDPTTHKQPSSTSTTVEQSCLYRSDARVYTWPFDSYTANAAHVLDMTHMVERRYGVKLVNVVGYSKGTQDVEEAVRLGSANFEHVVLLAPMYAGTPLADAFLKLLTGWENPTPGTLNCLVVFNVNFVEEQQCVANVQRLAVFAADTLTVINPGLTQLSTIPWQNPQDRLLATAKPLNPVVTVAGTDGCDMDDHHSGWFTVPFGFGFTCNPLLTHQPIPAPKTNDGAVPVWSVQAVPNPAATPVVTDIDHGRMPQSFASVFFQVCPAFLPAYVTPPGLDPVCNAALSGVAATASAHASLASHDVGIPTSIAQGPSSTLFLSPGASAQTVFPIPPSSSATTLVLANSSLAFSLIDPHGALVSGSGTNVAYANTSQPDGATAASYTITDPTPGSWTAVITNTGTLTTTATLVSNFDTTLQLTPGAPLITEPGATLPITATLADGATPITGAVITATVLLSGTPPLQAVLADQGSGTYAGSVTIPITATGVATIGLEAFGVDGAAPFDLEATTSSQLTSGQATFGPTYGEQAIDSTGDGLYDSLIITPTITSQQSADYLLSGDLTDASGNIITSASNVISLTAGVATPATLSFDGATIARSGINGPYHLENLALYDLDADAPTAGLSDAYTTATYQASQFEHPPVIVGKDVTDAGANPSGNGLFQTLDVTAPVQVSTTGTYTVSTQLVDSTGALIATTTQAVLLSTTSTPVVLEFPGTAIQAHGVNGPYQVKNITVTTAYGLVIADVDTLENTQAYLSSQFAGASQPGSGNPPVTNPLPLSTDTVVVPATATVTSTSTPTVAATTTPTSTSLPTDTATVTPTYTATALPILVIHNRPRTVVGGRKKACDLKGNTNGGLEPGCEIVSSISAPGATVRYVLTYADGTTQTFIDRADGRGHSLHPFNVAYLPPRGSRHGQPTTVVYIRVEVTLPDGTRLKPLSTRFAVIR